MDAFIVEYDDAIVRTYASTTTSTTTASFTTTGTIADVTDVRGSEDSTTKNYTTIIIAVVVSLLSIPIIASLVYFCCCKSRRPLGAARLNAILIDKRCSTRAKNGLDQMSHVHYLLFLLHTTLQLMKANMTSN